MLLLKINFSFYASAKDILFIIYFLVSLQIHILRASIFSSNSSRKTWERLLPLLAFLQKIDEDSAPYKKI